MSRAKTRLLTGYSIPATTNPSKLPPIKNDQQETPFVPIIEYKDSFKLDIHCGLSAMVSSPNQPDKIHSPTK